LSDYKGCNIELRKKFKKTSKKVCENEKELYFCTRFETQRITNKAETHGRVFLMTETHGRVFLLTETHESVLE